MSKKGENIYRRKDGRWEGRYIKNKTPEGKIIYGSVYGAKYSEVKSKLIKAKAGEIALKPLKEYKGDLNSWLNYWLQHIAMHHIKETTYSNYTRYLKKITTSSLSSKKIQDVTAKEIQLYIHQLQRQGLSPGSIRNIMNLLKKAFKEAESLEYIVKNPCENLTLPKLTASRVNALTTEEQKKLEKMAIKEKGCSPILLALYSGMRIGEISGLKWEDIDFEEQVIHVNRTLSRITDMDVGDNKTKIILGTPKSTQSQRVIPLADNLKHYLLQKKRYSTSEFVVSKGHKSVEPRLINYRFKKALEKAGIEDTKFHALRHTFATRCLENGVDVASVSKLLGHQSIKMTLDTYTDSMMSNRIEAIGKLDETFIKQK